MRSSIRNLLRGGAPCGDLVVFDPREGHGFSASPVSEAGPGQVLLRMQAAAVNTIQRAAADGARRAKIAGARPIVRRTDVAGIVEQIGDGVTRFAPGDRIFGQLAIAPFASDPGHAERLAVAEDAPLARVPDGLSPGIAAVLPTAGMAGLALVESLGPLRGKTVVIVGADGVVGAFATQLAVDARARVIVNVAEHDARQMLAYGVVDTIDDTLLSLPQAVANRGRIDALIDLSSDAGRFAALAAAVRPYGIAISTRGVADLAALEIAAVTGINFQLVPSASLLERLADALVTGRVVLPSITTMGLDRASAA